MAGMLALLLALPSAALASVHPNEAYRSPFVGLPFDHDVDAIHARHVALSRRQVTSADKYADKHYATFYGTDFGNSPFVWSGGVNFTHSVASGDPFDTSVLLWTRAAPLSTGPQPDQSVPICVKASIYAEGSRGNKAVDSVEAFTSYDVDWTTKVEVTGLKADTKYWYQFSDCTNSTTVSPVGRTRTLPHANTPAHQVNGGKPLTFAVFSCSQYPTGWFNAYGYAAYNTSSDIYVHLGDYIYEYANAGANIGRAVLGRELATIHDYRQRIAQYRTDQYLLAAHERGPWITVWDDHEVADNTWKAGSADSNDTAAGCAFSASGACFTDRKWAAVRAYHEWLPIRQTDVNDKLRIWRNFQVGKLLDLTMLDTRQYDRDLTDVYYNTDYVNMVSDYGNRSLMGEAQEQWFYKQLSQSQARGASWRVVGQQIVFTQLNELGSYDLDAWDGYRANRERVLDHLYQNHITNTVILSGDSHANWVSDLARPNDTTTYNMTTGAGAIGVEFAGTAVTSPSAFGRGIGPTAANAISTKLVGLNPDLQWSEGSYRGFFTITVSPTDLSATYYAMSNISHANLHGFASATFHVKSGANKLSRPVAGGAVKAGVLKAH